MCDVLGLAAALGSPAAAVIKGEKARKEQSRAASQARTEADKAMNRANPKKPNPLALSALNAQQMAGGPGSTMLTGPSGVQPSSLMLGRQTLLGGGG